MTVREKRLGAYLATMVMIAITFINASGAMFKGFEADEWQERCEQAAPLVAKLAATIAEKERLLAESKAVTLSTDTAVPDVYNLGEVLGRVLRSSGATVKGFTMLIDGKKKAVQYSARSDAATLARFLESMEEETPRIAITALTLGSGNDGWLELSIKAEYGKND